MSLTNRIKAEALRLGFDLVGALPAGPSLTHSFYESWLARGYAGEMAYLERHADLKSDLRRLAPQARSALMLAINYHHPPPSGPRPPRKIPYQGRISRYAWGADYHDLIKEKLTRLARFVDNEAGRPVQSWSYVDSAPVMEREFAARAGLGWVGKHGVLINWEQGSWLFLAELLLDIELDYDFPPGHALPTESQGEGPPLEALTESCGSCTACIDACPTDAIVAEKTVDSRLCISYHTIELRGPIPETFRPRIGDWVFGCDICQDVCPWNRRAPVSRDAAFGGTTAPSSRATPDLLHLLTLNEQEFRREFGGTALMRTKRRGLLRNAAIALGNRLAPSRAKAGAPEEGRQAAAEAAEAIAALRRCLGDTEPLIRGAAAWALGEAGTSDSAAAREALGGAAGREADGQVRGEIGRAMAKLASDKI